MTLKITKISPKMNIKSGFIFVSLRLLAIEHAKFRRNYVKHLMKISRLVRGESIIVNKEFSDIENDPEA